MDSFYSSAVITPIKKNNERLNQIFFKCSLKKSIFIDNVDQVHLNLLFLIIIFWFIWCLVTEEPRYKNSLENVFVFRVWTKKSSQSFTLNLETHR